MTARSMIVRTKLILRMGFCVAMMALMVLVGVVMANAKVYSGECGEYGKNITWTLDTETGVLSVDGYGCMKGYSQKVLPSWYSYREYIKEVTISSGITTIGSWSFYDCDNLEKVYIPESVTQIERYAFGYCKSLKEVNIPSRVKTIEHGTFSGCKSLGTIQIPEGVTTIQSNAFYNCNLRCVEIPDSVTEIGNNAFSGCSALERVTLSNQLVTIGDYAFYSCKSLSGMDFPHSLVSIGKYAFAYNPVWENLVIPDNLTSIGENCFQELSNLKQITVEAGNPVYHSDGNCLIETASKTLIVGCQTSVIPTDGSVTAIESNAFRGASALLEVFIPASVTSVGFRAFDNCPLLNSINVAPENPIYHSAGNCLIETESGKLILGCRTSMIPQDGTVKEIGDEAFQFCVDLKSITLPDGLVRIGDYAFAGCISLTEITFPTGLISIGDWAFYNCDSLSSVEFPDGFETIGRGAFESCDNLLTVTMTDSVKEMGKLAFLNCEKLEYVKLSDSITVLREGALAITSISSIDLPKNLQFTEVDVFVKCTKLRSLYIPASVTHISDCLIWECTGLESVTVDPNNPIYHSAGNCIIETATKTIIAGCNTSVIPDDGSVTAIGLNGFTGMSFSSIIIPHTITYIERGAFSDCVNLTDIYHPATLVSWKKIDIQDTSLKNVKVHCLTEFKMTNGMLNEGRYVEIETNSLATGLIKCSDDHLRVCIDGIPQYAGAVADSEGYVYYINSSTRASVQNRVYYVTENNGLLPSGYYTFDEQGRAMDGKGNYIKADTAMNNGIKFFADGSVRYFENGRFKYQGAVADEDGYIYYVNSATKAAVKDQVYRVTTHNGILPEGHYTFDAQGRAMDGKGNYVKADTAMNDGLKFFADGSVRYFENGRFKYQGAVADADGYIYYINSSTKSAIRGQTYRVTKTNGLLPAGIYVFDKQGRAMNADGNYAMAVCAD